MMYSHSSPRGITLLIAVILASVVLSVTLALLDIGYKQVLLASSAKQSQFAFYNADSALECALYWDQQRASFSYIASADLTGGISCSDGGVSQPITIWSAPNVDNPPNSSSAPGATRTTVFHIPCNGIVGGERGVVTITKSNTGATNIFATGYSSCYTNDPRRIERGLKIIY